MIVLVTSPGLHSVATYLSWKRNTQRKIEARKDAWEGGRKVSRQFYSLRSFLPLRHREFIKPLITCRANIEKLIWYESVTSPDLLPTY